MESIGLMATKLAAAIGVVPNSDSAATGEKTHLEQLGEAEENGSESIARLAYALWQRRGCPTGSSEQDWIEAEQQLRDSHQTPIEESIFTK